MSEYDIVVNLENLRSLKNSFLESFRNIYYELINGQPYSNKEQLLQIIENQVLGEDFDNFFIEALAEISNAKLFVYQDSYQKSDIFPPNVCGTKRIHPAIVIYDKDLRPTFIFVDCFLSIAPENRNNLQKLFDKFIEKIFYQRLLGKLNMLVTEVLQNEAIIDVDKL